MAPRTRWNPDGKDGVVFDTSHPDVALILMQWLMGWFAFAVTFYGCKFVYILGSGLGAPWWAMAFLMSGMVYTGLKSSGAFPDYDHNRPLRSWLIARCAHCKGTGWSLFYRRGHVDGSRWLHTRCHHEIQRKEAEKRLVRSIAEPL